MEWLKNQNIKVICTFILFAVFDVSSFEDKLIRYARNNTVKLRLCHPIAAYECMVERHFDTECMTRTNIIYGVDAKSMNLTLDDSYRSSYAACIYQKIKPLTKDAEINHDIYIEGIESKEDYQKFEKIYNDSIHIDQFPSDDISPIYYFKVCRIDRIFTCFRQQQCIMKSYYRTLLNVFDECKNESSKSNDISIIPNETIKDDNISSQFKSSSSTISEEKNEILNVIGFLPMTTIAAIRRYAQLDDDFKSYLCSK